MVTETVVLALASIPADGEGSQLRFGGCWIGVAEHICEQTGAAFYLAEGTSNAVAADCQRRATPRFSHFRGNTYEIGARVVPVPL